MPLRYKNRWIRIAGSSKRIKDGMPPPHWRCEIEGEDGIHLLTGWALIGEATKGNNTQGTKPTASGEDFLAWVSFYGNVLIEDNQRATISLLPVQV